MLTPLITTVDPAVLGVTTTVVSGKTATLRSLAAGCAPVVAFDRLSPFIDVVVEVY